MLSAQHNPRFDIFGSKPLNASTPLLLEYTGGVDFHVIGLVMQTAHAIFAFVVHESKCEIFSPCAASVLCCRSVLLEVGNFDEVFYCYVEDIDLSFACSWPIIRTSMCRNMWCIILAWVRMAGKKTISLSIKNIKIWCGRL